MRKSFQYLHVILFFGLFPLINSSTPLVGQEIDSVVHSYLGAKERAGIEQKEIILWFGAEWCDPCQEIKSDWLRNTEWIGSVANAYVQAWVDVDDFDGYVLKDQYQVDQLPTVLILSPEGAVQARKISAWNKSAFSNWLKHSRVNANPVARSDSGQAKQTTKNAPQEREEKSNSGLVQPHYRVQVGAYSTEERAEQRAQEIQTKTGVSISVHEQFSEHRRLFKLVSSKFDREARALNVRDKLKSFGIEGFVLTLKDTKNI